LNHLPIATRPDEDYGAASQAALYSVKFPELLGEMLGKVLGKALAECSILTNRRIEP